MILRCALFSVIQLGLYWLPRLKAGEASGNANHPACDWLFDCVASISANVDWKLLTVDVG